MIHNNQEKGLLGEKLAAPIFAGHGYEILASRYRTRYGEADLVARIQDTLVFVEVKGPHKHQAWNAGRGGNGQKAEKCYNGGYGILTAKWMYGRSVPV